MWCIHIYVPYTIWRIFQEFFSTSIMCNENFLYLVIKKCRIRYQNFFLIKKLKLISLGECEKLLTCSMNIYPFKYLLLFSHLFIYLDLLYLFRLRKQVTVQKWRTERKIKIYRKVEVNVIKNMCFYKIVYYIFY